MVDISRHPLLKQAYDVCQAIEACGASEELTAACVKASDFMQALNKEVELADAERDAQRKINDDSCVDAFNIQMKLRLAQKRKAGYSGWETCPIENLQQGFDKAVANEDFINVANYAMMLSMRGNR